MLIKALVSAKPQNFESGKRQKEKYRKSKDISWIWNSELGDDTVAKLISVYELWFTSKEKGVNG